MPGTSDLNSKTIGELMTDEAIANVVGQRTSDLVARIRETHRQRVFLIKQRIRCSNALGAYIRTCLGWSPTMEQADKDALKKQAETIVTAINKALNKNLPYTGEGSQFVELIAMDRAAQATYLDAEETIVKRLEDLAQQLPVWSSWAEGVHGFGAKGLATIIGEAGNLSEYPKKGHLWKRMGVGIIDGVRQGGLPSGAPAEDWKEHGYNRERRARLFGFIGTPLIKATGGPYREYYLDRKAFYKAKAEAEGKQVVPGAKIPAKRKDEFMSDMHVHRRAQRKMEKRLLRDLLAAWKRAEQSDFRHSADKANLAVSDCSA